MDEVKKLLREIQALCENPHWSSNRRWDICDRAIKCQQLLQSDAPPSNLVASKPAR